MSVARAQREIDSREFVAWQAYYEIHPFGDIRLDVGIARLCALTVDIHSAKGSRAAKISDFLWDDDIPRVPKSSDELEREFHNSVVCWNMRPKRKCRKASPVSPSRSEQTPPASAGG
ncbi:MAG TPA: DUF4035 domain-containing protein [Rhodospirillales bacterium]|nr:DUF4035 domain-containing protein [Rhodospirillales bacterium]